MSSRKQPRLEQVLVRLSAAERAGFEREARSRGLRGVSEYLRKSGLAQATRQYAYTAEIEPAKEGGYVVSFPALPGCVTQGETYDQAIANAHECLQGFIEAMAKVGRPLPREQEPKRRTKIVVTAKAAAGA